MEFKTEINVSHVYPHRRFKTSSYGNEKIEALLIARNYIRGRQNGIPDLRRYVCNRLFFIKCRNSLYTCGPVLQNSTNNDQNLG
jgi:hypothetical protein